MHWTSFDMQTQCPYQGIYLAKATLQKNDVSDKLDSICQTEFGCMMTHLMRFLSRQIVGLTKARKHINMHKLSSDLKTGTM